MEEYKITLMWLIHKKGDKRDCENYKKIALLNMAYKIFSNCILIRIKGKTDQTIGNYQGGFKSERLTTDKIFIIRQFYQNT